MRLTCLGVLADPADADPPTLEEIRQALGDLAAIDVAARLKSVPGLADLRSSLEAGNPELHLIEIREGGAAGANSPADRPGQGLEHQIVLDLQAMLLVHYPKAPVGVRDGLLHSKGCGVERSLCRTGFRGGSVGSGAQCRRPGKRLHQAQPVVLWTDSGLDAAHEVAVLEDRFG